MATVLVEFSLTDDDLISPIPLDAVLVRVYSEDGQTFVTEGSTDATGKVFLLLEDLTTFWVRFFKIGYAFPTKALIAVEGASEFDIQGRDVVEHYSPIDPNLCRITGILLNVFGAPAPNLRLSFLRTDLVSVVGGRVIIGDRGIVFSDKNGVIELELVRNAVYEASVQGYNEDSFLVRIPDMPSCDVTELLFPYVLALEFCLPSVAVAVGEEKAVEVKAVMSNGLETPYDLTEDEMVTVDQLFVFSVDDAGIAEVSVAGLTGLAHVIGRSPGTTTVTATLSKSEARKRQPVPVTTIGSLTVTVT